LVKRKQRKEHKESHKLLKVKVLLYAGLLLLTRSQGLFSLFQGVNIINALIRKLVKNGPGGKHTIFHSIVIQYACQLWGSLGIIKGRAAKDAMEQGVM